MFKAGLIGDPVDHSLSPYMHNAAFEALKIDAHYALWGASLADLPARIETLREDAILGANVTVPHKQVVMPLVDELSDTARRIGAVNTIIPRDGRLLGDNTDAFGFARSLRETCDGRAPGKAVVVGAGGASRAVLVSLQEIGVAEIVLVNRTLAKAESLAGDLADGEHAIRVVAWDDLADTAASTDVLVNATSIGWHGDELPFDATVIEALPDAAVVMDLTYRKTALLHQAKARGLREVDGLPMLIYQGARAFSLWTGQVAPVEVMTEAVLVEQARRA